MSIIWIPWWIAFLLLLGWCGIWVGTVLDKVPRLKGLLWGSSRFVGGVGFLEKWSIVNISRLIKATILVPTLIEVLRDGDDDGVRQYAAQALGEIGAEQAVPALIEALHDESHGVRGAVAKALGEIGDVQAVSALIEALHDEDDDVRGPAAQALGEIGDVQAVPALIDALHDEDDGVRISFGVRISIVEALGEIGSEQAVPALVEVLRDEDDEVRESAAEALMSVMTETTLSSVLLVARQKWWVLFISIYSKNIGLELIGQAAARYTILQVDALFKKG